MLRRGGAGGLIIVFFSSLVYEDDCVLKEERCEPALRRLTNLRGAL